MTTTMIMNMNMVITTNTNIIIMNITALHTRTATRILMGTFIARRLKSLR